MTNPTAPTTLQKRRLAGLCVSCGGPLDVPGVRCAVCRDHHREQSSLRQAKVTAERKAAGLCVTCGKPNNTTNTRCAVCTAKNRWSNNKAATQLRLNRDEAGLCIQCGAPRDNETKRCNVCRAKHAEECSTRMKEVRQERTDLKVCRSCGCVTEAGYHLCLDCRSVAAAANHRHRVRARQEKKVCVRCTQPLWHGHQFKCRYHFVYDLLHNYASRAGHPRVPEELVETMAARLEEQNFKCAYTGKELVPGTNASIDHIIPLSDRPDLALTADNMIWTDKEMNTVKQAVSISNLLALADTLKDRREALLKLEATTTAAVKLPLV